MRGLDERACDTSNPLASPNPLKMQIQENWLLAMTRPSRSTDPPDPPPLLPPSPPRSASTSPESSRWRAWYSTEPVISVWYPGWIVLGGSVVSLHAFDDRMIGSRNVGTNFPLIRGSRLMIGDHHIKIGRRCVGPIRSDQVLRRVLRHAPKLIRVCDVV
jgi:hypothetical protein